MKLTAAVVATLALFMGPGNAQNDPIILSDKPYSLVFTYSGTPSVSCDNTFVRLRNTIYQDYINNVEAFTSAEFSDIERVDPVWKTIQSVYDYSLNPEKDNLFGISANDTSASTSSTTTAAATMTTTTPNDVVRYSGPADTLPNLRRARELEFGREERELAEDPDCGLAIKVGRPRYSDCTLPPTNLIGSKTHILTLERGGAIAEMFFENVDLYLNATSDPCHDIINAMTYKVLDLTL